MNLELEQLERLGQGNTAEVFRVDGGRILKLFRQGMPDAAIQWEFHMAQAVQDTLDNVPRAYELVEVQGRRGIIYEEIKGPPLFSMMLKKPWKMAAYSRDLARYHIDMQVKAGERLPTVKDKLVHDLEGVKCLTEAEKESVRQYLCTLPDGNALCHFDFHPGNIMMQNRKPVIIDWMTACRGDPCADAARTVLMITYSDLQHVPWLVKKASSVIQKIICRHYLAEYQKRTGASAQDINKWLFPIAAARLMEWITDTEKGRLLKLVRESIRQAQNPASV